jgi:phage recombination protein Bet
MSSIVPISIKEITDKFTPDQIELIKNTVAKNATMDELKLFLYRCSLLQLNPLKPGQIHFIKYGNNAGTVVVGIEGFRSASARTGKHVSTERGITRSDDGSTILYGWAIVRRRDQSGEIQEYKESVPFAEFNNPNNPSWKKMPETMIKKVAEAATLRMAYPDDLGGIYIEEEEEIIKKNQPEQKTPWIVQPTAEEIGVSHEYYIPFGYGVQRTMEQAYNTIGKEKLMRSVELTEQALANRKVYKGSNVEEMKDYILRMSKFLAAKENGTAQDEPETEDDPESFENFNQPKIKPRERD